MRILYFLFIQIAFGLCAFSQSFSYEPPENFIKNQDATVLTFSNSAAGAIIQISTQNTVNFTEFYNTFNREQFIINGLEIIAEDVNIINNVVQHFYFKCKYTVQQEHEGQISEFIRIIYFTQNKNALIMAVASFPLLATEIIQKPIMQSFNNLK